MVTVHDDTDAIFDSLAAGAGGYLVKGLLLKEIAQQLGISYWTVQEHIARVYQKLHVHSRSQAVAKYLGK